jgi:hypothetical protein
MGRLRLSILILLASGLAAPPASEARQRDPAARADARARACLIRACLLTHRALVVAAQPLPLPESDVLSSATACSKRYAASWTCRESSRLLIAKLGRGRALQLSSSGENAFLWGKEGWVSYHYYAVDDRERPRLLVDPTAASNFRHDVQPGGLLRGFLAEAGRELGQPAAAERVAARILRGGENGLLVLASQSEIAVYRHALESAAALRARVAREAERR